MKRILYFVLLLICIRAQAQVQVKTFTDKETILIGERFTMTIESFMPLDQQFSWPMIDTLPNFQIISSSEIDTTENFNSRKVLQSFLLTSFDSGHYTIPSITFLVGNVRYVSDTVGIDIGYSPMDPNPDYKEIKDILDVEDSGNRYLYWFLAGVVLVLGLLLWYFLRKKKQPVKVVEEKKLSPYEEAMMALENIRKSGFIQNGSVKKYYSELNDILRNYLDTQLQLHSMKKTNEEIIFELRSLDLNKEDQQKLTDALRIADFVKFAKYQPDESMNEQNYTIVRNAIQSLNKSRS
ncbi:MAG: BatD family protein [Flavitalea sp.]